MVTVDTLFFGRIPIFVDFGDNWEPLSSMFNYRLLCRLHKTTKSSIHENIIVPQSMKIATIEKINESTDESVGIEFEEMLVE